NVIIMAVQKAAYGIDLSSASRVFFVSPVWQPAMEQQAIKRAHRIGQKRPVYVETLVIQNTIEDALLQRRNQVSSG
ncbi:P-loop containing nucleoside triphosphate hydrolase protein, partial [Mycotypha africana]|uniref:P-loop containing nucleoside triphosphate hydrolase protein n=1 Tax=Mycotypha africana TaxID=64632 RepID=UPI0023007AC0